jgi:O-antigen/teichoic acid export membrane protein
MAGTIASGFLSYVSVTFAARLLEPANFGLLGALLGFVTFTTAMLRPAGFAATHLATSIDNHRKGPQLRGLAGLAIGIGLVLAAVIVAFLAVFANALAHLLRSGDSWHLVLLAPLLGTVACLQLMQGIMAGAQKFRWLSVSSVIDAGARALVTVPLVTQFSVAGSLSAYAAGQLAAIACCVVSLGGIGWNPPSRRRLRASMHTGTAAVALLVIMTLLQTGDLLLLRSYAAPDAVGLYAVCATVGSLLVTLASPLYLPAFPRAVAAHMAGRPTAAVLYLPLALVLAVGAISTLAAIWLGTSVTELAFGAAFAGAGLLLPIYLAKSTALLVALLVGQHAIAVGRGMRVWLAVPPTVGALAALVVLHPDSAGAAVLMVAFSVTAAGVLAFAALVPSHGH